MVCFVLLGLYDDEAYPTSSFTVIFSMTLGWYRLGNGAILSVIAVVGNGEDKMKIAEKHLGALVLANVVGSGLISVEATSLSWL